LGYVLHRPQFFEKKCMPVVTQGFFGGGAVARYLQTVNRNMGFDTVKGCVLNTLVPTTDKIEKQNAAKLHKAAVRFHRALTAAKCVPSFYALFMFRTARTNVKNLAGDYYDYQHYDRNGWLQSQYCMPQGLGFWKRAAGHMFDWLCMRFIRTQ
jgi:hypothetical protein